MGVTEKELLVPDNPDVEAMLNKPPINLNNLNNVFDYFVPFDPSKFDEDFFT